MLITYVILLISSVTVNSKHSIDFIYVQSFQLATNPKPREMLNPVFLNGILTKSLRSSMHADDKYADHLSFAIKYAPPVLQQTAHNTLDCLELRYKVSYICSS